MTNIKIVAVFLTLDLLVILCSLYLGSSWLLNTQAGFISSFVLTALSLFGYKKMVESKTRNEDAEELLNERDVIDKIEDPYDLYDEEEQPKPKMSKLKTSVQNVKTSAGGYFSIYRILGYIIFFAAFLALIKSGYFSFLPFIIGISVTPLGVLACGIFVRNKE